MITAINEPKTLTNHISCEFKYRFDAKKCDSSQWWNNEKCWYGCKKSHLCEKDYIWNPFTCNCKHGKYLASVISNLVITCDKTIDAEAKSNNVEIKTVQQILMKRKLYISPALSLISIALLIAASI